MKKLIILCLLAFPFTSCEELPVKDIFPDAALSNEEIIKGLKAALEISTDTSVKKLNALNGYYMDEAVKILLPEEAGVIFQHLSKIPGGNLVVENTILAINRAAEDAAVKAKPIFADAIVNITFTDALSILNGNDSAASTYLSSSTYSSLAAAFAPEISESLSKPLLGNNSAESLYAGLVSNYNTIAALSFGTMPLITDNSLGEYTTRKALDGLFRKVKDEEAKIRKNASHRVNDILQKIFNK
jgi:hypothetical protein